MNTALPHLCVKCGDEIRLGESFLMGSGVNRGNRTHARCMDQPVVAPVTHHVHTVTCPVHEDWLRDLRDDNASLRAALASLVASVTVAEHRGWHHMQISAVNAAALAADKVLRTTEVTPKP